MAREDELVLALEVLTEGAGAEVLPETVAAETVAAESFVHASEALRKDARSWTLGAGVQGVGIGRRITAGRELEELCLKVYVAEKKAMSKVRCPVPRRVEVPEVGEVETDVEEIGQVRPEVFTGRVRPAMPGCSVGHPDVTAGTLGCLVRKRGEDGLFILSNSHVLANSGLAGKGDGILQPGAADRGTVPGDVLADLEDFVSFQFSGVGYPNYVDAAIARVRNPSEVDARIRLLGVKPAGANTNVERNMQVKKVGRTTDFTIGVVRDIHYRTAVWYKRSPTPPYRKARVGFRDQVLCTRYTAPGDSGSVVLNQDDEVVGLHFAGSPSTSIFNRIEHVLAAFGVEIV